jgi:hypothetical protein
VPSIGLVVFFIVILILGRNSNAAEQERVRGEAQMSMRTVEQRWLPLILTLPAKIEWGTPTFTRTDYYVTGALEGHRGDVKVAGGFGETYFTLDLKTSVSFELIQNAASPLTAMEVKDVERRVKSWLAAAGISPIICEHLYGFVPEGKWDFQIEVPGPRPRELDSSKEFRINISIVPSVGRARVRIFLSADTVMWKAYDRQVQ